jgi:hypothetical protein
MWTLLYDAECALCRMLAGLLSGPVMPWQEAGGPRHSEAQPKNPFPAPTDIGVADLGQDPPLVITGQEAWEILINQEPGLRKWQWIAAKLGLSERAAAATLRHGAHLARRICTRCGPHSPTRSNQLIPRPEQEIRKNPEKEEP